MQTEHLKISGMTCAGCISKVKTALEAVAGVSEVSVSLPNHAATVSYDEMKTAPDKLAAAVVAAGYGVGSTQHPQSQPTKRGCC
ncbi:MAG: heavy-metal-associated domain-containing protein [Stagnimonas sp.]|nr:heavy-metal-associated domain-containing protein [Stagnimonas sp.]